MIYSIKRYIDTLSQDGCFEIRLSVAFAYYPGNLGQQMYNLENVFKVLNIINSPWFTNCFAF